MPTKQDILNSINTLSDNGNNTANKVRTILTSLLNFTENPAPVVIPTIPVVQYIKLDNATAPLTSAQGNAKLLYSIIGIKTQMMNMNLKLNFSTATMRNYQFIVPTPEAANFQLIFPAATAAKSYMVPVTNTKLSSTSRVYRSWSMEIGYTNKILSINLYPILASDSLKVNDQILTSIALIPN